MTTARPPENRKTDRDPTYSPTNPDTSSASTNEQDSKKPAFFATENLEDSICRAGMAIRREQTAIFARYSEPIESFYSRDHDREIAQVSTQTGMSKSRVDTAITAYMGLRNLPKLRELQLEHHRLDIERLAAVSDGLADLGLNVLDEVYDKFDDMLTALFTPTKMGQQLPTITAITRRINVMIADFDSEAGYDLKKRKEREEKTDPFGPGEGAISFDVPPSGSGEPGNAYMNVAGDKAKVAAMRAEINATARELGVSQWEALDLLIFGKAEPTSATIYGYVPLVNGVPDPTKSVFIPGFGWTTAAATEAFHCMVDRIIDLEEAKHHTVAGYVAPDKVKAYVRGCDGKCIFPGCTRSAWSCQLDHRIPYDDGGQTNAANLYCLCAHHHNMKTDRRAFYVPDPVTGEIIWLFDDGTYARTEPEGFIGTQVTPTAPRWRASTEDSLRSKRKKAHFFAKGHTLIDAYENREPHPSVKNTVKNIVENTEDNTETGDLSPITYEECLEAIAELEKDYGLEFPFRPDRLEEADGESQVKQTKEGKPPF